MLTITLEGWNPGLNKVKLNHLLRRYASFGLAEAKQAVDSVLAGERVTFIANDFESMMAFCSEAKLIGAVCSCIPDESKASIA